MGYMGFGMRKENYSRKPKKAFKKLKEVYGDNLNLPTSIIYEGSEAEESFPQKKRVSFFRTVEFKVCLLVLVLILSVGLSWSFLFKEQYLKYKKLQFETVGISEFYIRNKSEFDYLNKFLSARLAILKSIVRVPESNVLQFSVVYQNPGKNSLPENQDSSVGEKGSESFNSMSEDTLQRTAKQEDYHPRIYKLKLKNGAGMSASFLSYLNATSQEIEKFSKIIWTTKTDVYNEEKVTIVFNHSEFGDYRIVYGHLPAEYSPSSGSTQLGEISEGVYWERIRK